MSDYNSKLQYDVLYTNIVSNITYKTYSFYEKIDDITYRYIKEIELNKNTELLNICISGQNPATDDSIKNAKINSILDRIINDIGCDKIHKIIIINLWCRCDSDIIFSDWNDLLMKNEYEDKNIQIIEDILLNTKIDKVILFHGQHFTQIPLKKFNWKLTYIKFNNILSKFDKLKSNCTYHYYSLKKKMYANIPFPYYISFTNRNRLITEIPIDKIFFQHFPIEDYICPLNY